MAENMVNFWDKTTLFSTMFSPSFLTLELIIQSSQLWWVWRTTKIREKICKRFFGGHELALELLQIPFSNFCHRQGTMFLDTAQKKRWSSVKTWWHHSENLVPPWQKRGVTMVAFSKV